MKVELTPQDIKCVERIKKLTGNKEPLTEPGVWVVVSNALIEYEKHLKDKGDADV